MNSKRRTIQLTFEYFVDLTALIFANIMAMLICSAIKKMPYSSTASFHLYAVAVFISYNAVFLCFSHSLNLLQRSRTMEMITVLRNCLLTYMANAVMLVLTRNDFINGRYVFILSLVFYIALSSLNRYVLKRILIYRFSNSKMVSLVGVITVSERAQDFVEKLSTDWSRKIEGLALLDAKYENGVYKHQYCKTVKDEKGVSTVIREKEFETVREISGIKICANRDNIISWIKATPLDEVFINVPHADEYETSELVEEIESMGITVHVNIPSIENLVEKSEFNNVSCTMIAGFPTATLTATEPMTVWESFIKRILDIIGGLIGSIISLPIIAITAIPLLIESPGPLIFKQPRVGKNGRIFYIYKLRSMYTDAEERKKELMSKNKMDGLMFKMDNDPRITKVGRFIRKTSIDELPQFWNVLKGDMSLVGTRPPTVDEFEQYESHHKRRLSMRPGITGMWQVSGRSNIQDFEEVVRLDVEYIDNWSMWLDIKILLKTIVVVLKGRGAE